MSLEDKSGDDLSRREFVALTAAAGVTVGVAGSAAAADRQVVEENVEIKTPNGACDAAFAHPASGTYPGVLVWTDVFGLRPVFRDMAKRLAAEGYAVLVPNPFYRTVKSPVFTDTAGFNFQDPAARAKLNELTAPLNAEGAAESDARTFIAWLDQQKAVNKRKKIGTQGYCMGGPLVFKTAAQVPNRVAAVGSFHGGGLVTDQPNSPHLLAPKFKGASFYVAIAANDDERQPDAKDKLRDAFTAANVTNEIEVFSAAQHGWCVPGSAVYKQDDAEKAWAKLLALYRKQLA